MHVLADRGFEEPFRRNDRRPPGGDVFIRHHTPDSPEVVDVAVRVDHGVNRSLPELPVDQRERGARSLRARERIDHDPTRLPANERDVRQVEAADLAVAALLPEAAA